MYRLAAARVKHFKMEWCGNSDNETEMANTRESNWKYANCNGGIYKIHTSNKSYSICSKFRL